MKSTMKAIVNGKLLLTNKYSCGLFIVWIAFWQYAIHQKKDVETLSKMQICKTDSNITIQDFKIDLTSVWGQNWIFDMFTCNQPSLEKHTKRNGPVVFWSNFLFSYVLLLKSLIPICKKKDIDDMHTFFAGSFFLCSSLMYRIANYQVNDSSVTFWIIPEFVWLIICFAKWSSTSDLIRNSIKKINISYAVYGFAALIGGPLFLLLKYLISIVFIILHIIGSVLSFEDDPGVRSLLFTIGMLIILISGEIITYLFTSAIQIVYRAAKTVISNEKFTHQDYRVNIKDFSRALLPYHWSSSYIPDKAVISQEMSKNAKTHSTAFNWLFMHSLKLLMATHTLTLNLRYWTHHLKDDPHFSMETWEMYVRILILQYGTMKLAGNVLDKILLPLLDGIS